jgi:hypothetical protein
MLRFFSLPLLALGLLFFSVQGEGEALAQGKPSKSRPAKATKAAPAKPKKAAKPLTEAEKDKEATPAASESDAKAAAEAEPKLRAAGTNRTESTSPKGSVKEKEGPEGVKTYQFGEIEVEGRQKSPQLIYFLRRVRAEFDAGALGHRSFLGELKDTRNDTAFR